MEIRPTPGFPARFESDRDVGPSALVSWMRRNRVWLRHQLIERGALLFRGFGIREAATLEQVADALGLGLMDYSLGATPRHVIQGRIYTSTDAVATVPIPLHNEMSYTSIYPEVVVFCCRVPATRRGETPLADMARVCRRLPREIVEPFEQRGVRYVQRFPAPGARTRHKTWDAVFGTTERAEVERICRERGGEAAWEASGRLRLTQVRPALQDHPVTGERCWFNQAHVFHRSFSAELRHAGRKLQAGILGLVEAAQRAFPGRGAPPRFDAAYGDGSPIPLPVMDEIRRVIWRESVDFSWRRGDMLLLDNLRIGHGRMPFRGPRQILAALASWKEDQTVSNASTPQAS